MGVVDLGDLVPGSWAIRLSGASAELILSHEEILASELGESNAAGFLLDVTEIGAEADLPADIAQRARVMIVEVRVDRPASMQRLVKLRGANPNLAIVAAVRDTSLVTVRALLRVGISDVIALPLRRHDLESVLTQMRAELESGCHAVVPSGKTVSIIKSVGGVGATALLTQLAARYAEREADRGRRTCLFDLDLQCGNAASYLGLTPAMTLTELFEVGSRLDAAVLRSVATQHRDGLDVFAAPAEMMPLEAISTEQVCNIAQLASMDYGTVFLDLPSDWTNWSLSLIARSQIVFLVVELTIASLRQAQRQLALLEKLGLDPNAVQIVVNRVEKRLFKQIDLRDAAETLGRPVSLKVSGDFALVSTALNRGVLLHELQRKNAVSRDLAALMDSIDMLLERG